MISVGNHRDWSLWTGISWKFSKFMTSGQQRVSRYTTDCNDSRILWGQDQANIRLLDLSCCRVSCDRRVWLHDYCLFAISRNLYISQVSYLYWTTNWIHSNYVTSWTTEWGNLFGLMMEDQKQPLLTDCVPYLTPTLQDLIVNIQLQYRMKFQIYWMHRNPYPVITYIPLIPCKAADQMCEFVHVWTVHSTLQAG